MVPIRGMQQGIVRSEVWIQGNLLAKIDCDDANNTERKANEEDK